MRLGNTLSLSTYILQLSLWKNLDWDVWLKVNDLTIFQTRYTTKSLRKDFLGSQWWRYLTKVKHVWHHYRYRYLCFWISLVLTQVLSSTRIPRCINLHIIYFIFYRWNTVHNDHLLFFFLHPTLQGRYYTT